MTNLSSLVKNPEWNIVPRSALKAEYYLAYELSYKAFDTMKTFAGVTSVKERARPWGYNVQTAPYSKMMSYYTIPNLKRSKSLCEFNLMKIAVRFPNLIAQDYAKVSRFFTRVQFDKILSEAKNDNAYFGGAAFSSLMHTIETPRAKAIRMTNDRVKVVRK